MRGQVIEIITNKHLSSGGNCGLTITQIRSQLNCDLQELKKVLNELFKDNQIKIKDGIHGKLILMNN